MNPKEIVAVSELPAKKRYEYFIKKIADFEEVWGLYNKGWATTADNNGTISVPFWPKKEFASLCATGEWASYAPESIELEEFIQHWLPGIEKDGYDLSIFWNQIDSAILKPSEVLKDLNNELEKY